MSAQSRHPFAHDIEGVKGPTQDVYCTRCGRVWADADISDLVRRGLSFDVESDGCPRAPGRATQAVREPWMTDADWDRQQRRAGGQA